jgi:hypothetical protein
MMMVTVVAVRMMAVPMIAVIVPVRMIMPLPRFRVIIMGMHMLTMVVVGVAMTVGMIVHVRNQASL